MNDKAHLFLFNELIEYALKNSDNPGKLGVVLTEQIRELIGGKIVIMLYYDENRHSFKLMDVSPLRRKEFAVSPQIISLAEACRQFKEAVIINCNNSPEPVSDILNKLDVNQSIYVPLILNEIQIGSIIILDIFCDVGLGEVVKTLNKASSVFALTVKNAMSFQLLEDKVESRTKEIVEKNRLLEKSELLLKQQNNEYWSLNEELKSSNAELKVTTDALKESYIELEKAKAKVEESEEKFRQLAEFSNDVFWLRTDEKMLYVNPAFENVFGISAEQIYQNPQIFTDVIHPEDKPAVFTIFKSPEFKEKGIFNLDYRIIKPNGEIRWINARTNAIFDRTGIVIKRVGIAIDITDKKIIEIELIKAKEKAEESDRLKTAFLQNMSHEIRTPLNAICGFSGMLNKPVLPEEKRKSFISIIQNSSYQLLSIITDILTISSLETKQEKANIEKVCINNIIVELLSIFKQQAQNQNISIYAKQQLSDKQSEIYTDKTKVTQILTNLLANAIKFTHDGFIEFGYNLKDYNIEFYVKDTGIGIKPEFHETIFERFRQAGNSINKFYGGTGLGLSISKGFAEMLGGKIWVQSEPEKGSTFYFTIPYTPVNEQVNNNSTIQQSNNRPVILVAEDEEFNFLFIEELLIEFDCKLIHAKDGQETIDVFNSNPNIDLILMDIKMPIMTGHEAAIIIKELKPELPIVAQSAYALQHERAKYEGIFDDYLAKPINENDLKQKVMKYIKFDRSKS